MASKTSTTAGLGYGYLSLSLFALSGLIVNVTIANFYGADGLGVFAQALSVFLLGGQLVTGSLHLTTFKDIAANWRGSQSMMPILSSAMTVGLFVAIPVALALFALAMPLADVLGSAPLGSNIRIIAVALLPFFANKLILGALSGMERLADYYAFTALRHTVLVLSVVLMSASDLSIHLVSLSLFFAEFITLAAILLRYRPLRRLHALCPRRFWLASALENLRKGYTVGLYPELNLRVDVVMIGLLLSDEMVGVYSICSALFEGLVAALGVVRVSVNPRLARILSASQLGEATALMKYVALRVVPCGVMGFALSYAIYVDALGLVFKDERILASFYPFHILLFFLVAVSWLIPFNHAFLHAGMVREYGLLQRNAFLINLVLNYFMIRLFGVEGAALSTGISLAFFEVAWYHRLRKCFGRAS